MFNHEPFMIVIKTINRRKNIFAQPPVNKMAASGVISAYVYST